MTTDTLLCLKINSTFHTTTLVNNTQLLTIQQLSNQLPVLTHKEEVCHTDELIIVEA
jgi:hypothetical protein